MGEPTGSWGNERGRGRRGTAGFALCAALVALGLLFAATAVAGAGAKVAAATNSKLGKIIVDSRGFTLYDFHKDRGGRSSCYGSCASVWPPLLTRGAPRATAGAKAALLGTTRRKNGTTQVTYDGHPLYTYVGDRGPGDTAGNGITEFGGSWHALQPSGVEAG